MAARNREAAILRVLAHEGGYTNHPSDPGGPTNWGITIYDARKYWKSGATASDVKAMPKSVAVEIYRAKYWDALRCDDLPAGVDYAAFDYGVNSGIGRSGKVLRRVVGIKADDWRVTDAVLAQCALRKPEAVVNAICDEREKFLRSLKTWPVFGKGWSRRVIEVRKAALTMAENAAPISAVTLSEERAKATPPAPAIAKASTAAPAATVGPVVAAGAAQAAGWQSEWMIGIAVAAIAVVAIAAGIAAYRHKRSAEVPMPGTDAVPLKLA